MPRRKWTQAEIEFLEKHYFNTPKYTIAKCLNRSYKSILNYAWSHKLSSYEKQYNIGIKQSRQIDLSPTFALGCICGLILGDGYISTSKSHNYTIALKTTKADFAQYFAGLLEKTFSSLTIRRLLKICTRKFPNGSIKTDINYLVLTDSKMLYEVIKPFKKRDYHWEMPNFLMTSDSQRGFLRGIFDAEGCVSTCHANKKGLYYCEITLGSKHKDNLIPIQELLFNFGIQAKLYNRNNVLFSTLEIHKKEELVKFQKLINFGYKLKSERLEELLWQQKQLRNVVSAATP